MQDQYPILYQYNEYIVFDINGFKLYLLSVSYTFFVTKMVNEYGYGDVFKICMN